MSELGLFGRLKKSEKPAEEMSDRKNATLAIGGVAVDLLSFAVVASELPAPIRLVAFFALFIGGTSALVKGLLQHSKKIQKPLI